VPTANPAVVVSHEVWQQQLGGRDDIVGEPVAINGHTFEIVGVASPDFAGMATGGRLPTMSWISLAAAMRFSHADFGSRATSRDSRWLFVRGRLRAETAVADVARDVSAVAAALDREHPLGVGLPQNRRLEFAVSRPWITRLSSEVLIDEGVTRPARIIAPLLLSAVGMVLLVACTNIANMMLARGALRRQELAVRLALGASRGRMIAECAGEAFIIAVVGGVLGLGLTGVILRMLNGPIEVAAGASFLLQPRFDVRVFAVGLGSIVAALLVAGVLPGYLATRGDVRGEGIAGSSPAVTPRWRIGRVLITLQVAVSIVLLGTAALYLAEAEARSRITGGLDLDRFAVVGVDFLLQNVDADRRDGIVARVLDRLSSHPAVDRAAVVAGLPIGPMPPPGSEHRHGDQSAYGVAIAVTPGVFDAVGLEILAGRGFDEHDDAVSEPVVILDTAAAQRILGDADAIGRQIEVTRMASAGSPADITQLRTVVGIVETVSGVNPRAAGASYVPLSQQPEGRLQFVARSDDDPERMAREIEAALMIEAPTLAVSLSGSGRSVLATGTRFVRVVMTVAAILGACGLAIVLAGLYGALSYLVSRRTREIGLRLALGAPPRQVMMMILREGLVPVMFGLAVGGAIVYLLRPIVAAGLGPETPAANIAAIVGAPLLLLSAAAVACYLPARRATRVDPASALKH
jgi:predicted permease